MKITSRQLRKIIRESLHEGYNSMSSAGKAHANRVKRKFMKLYSDANVGIDGREGWITVNGKKAVNMSQASGRPLTDEEMIDKMHAVYAGGSIREALDTHSIDQNRAYELIATLEENGYSLFSPPASDKNQRAMDNTLSAYPGEFTYEELMTAVRIAQGRGA